jgi:hypothetical protein
MLWRSHDGRDGSDVLIVRDHGTTRRRNGCALRSGWRLRSWHARLRKSAVRVPTTMSKRREPHLSRTANPKLYDSIYVVSTMVEWARSLHALK